MMDQDTSERSFEAERRRLLSLAYRMLGSYAEAEDVVQETWVRWHRDRPDDLREAGAWLTTVTTRLCLDQLRSARVRREQYVGPWLPEPVDTGTTGPFEAMTEREDLSLALLLTLEALNPKERAAFLLHDVFDYGFAEIASALETSEANSRQLASRARRKIRAERPAARPPREEVDRLFDAFAEACLARDPASLLSLLSPDAVLLSDGGGKVIAARNPIVGAEHVVRFLAGILRKRPANATVRRLGLNGAPALAVYVDDVLNTTFHIDTAGGKIRRIFAVRNPDKLARIGAALR